MARGRIPLRGEGRLTAILGPTNTGKTHRAIEKMLGHSSGMIGLPLRLLAREVYDKIVARKGVDVVALVTGEEKRIPKGARYWVCTVEAMPTERAVSFLAVDEIQLAGDRNRGHVFTDRILRCRGVRETLFLGSDTIEGLLTELVPDIEIERQPRLSKLTSAGCAKLTATPRRSAVVAFSVDRVYTFAERLRAMHGGTAVVLGALSPRARNAQVAMYQAGEVHHLVATDAIGMGLNLDIRHVAFTALRKYDGRGHRALTSGEVAQIAGRAGRFRTDGTFGTTREVGPMEADLVAAVERHAFPALQKLYWRNSDLDFATVDTLLTTLRRRPPSPRLVPMWDEDDHRALAELGRRSDLRGFLDEPDAVRRLWSICQVPDFRKTMTGSHVELLGQIALALLGPQKGLATDWVARRVERLDEPEGDIDTLMARIAYIRTWTYIAFQRGWVPDAAHWQERTRAIEDRLSDALHERLQRRFVDRRVVVAVGGGALDVEVSGDVVNVSGTSVGALRGLTFVSDPEGAGTAERVLNNAIRRSLKPMVSERVDGLVADEPEIFSVDERCRIVWRGAPVAQLLSGPGVLEPRFRLHHLDLLDAPQKASVRDKIRHWVADWIGTLLAPLRSREHALSPPALGVLYALEQGLGAVPTRELRRQLRTLTEADRRSLAKMSVRIGVQTVYSAAMLGPGAVRARSRLWKVHTGVSLPTPGHGRASFAYGEGEDLAPIGYRGFGDLAVRVDTVEKVASWARERDRSGEGTAIDLPMSWMGCKRPQVVPVLRGLGFVLTEVEPGILTVRRRKRARHGPRP